MLSDTPFATPDTPGLVRGKYVTTDGPSTADDVREAIMRERLEFCGYCRTLGCPMPAEMNGYCAECWERAGTRLMRKLVEDH